MSSKAELQEIVVLTKEIRTLLNELDREELPRVKNNVNEMRSLLTNSVLLMNRIGLPPPFSEAVNKMRLMIQVGTQLYLVLQMLNAASGPWGWALAGVGVLTYAVTVPDAMGSLIM